jgi:hypothetical protein
MQFPFSFWQSSGPDLMSGADGALVLNNQFLAIDAGSIKRYSSVSITNGSQLFIAGAGTYQLDVNDGHLPTLIGCKGNFTIDATSNVTAVENGRGQFDGNQDATYMAAFTPHDSAMNPVQYVSYGGYGGEGGSNANISGPGYDNFPYGHGGGGAGGLPPFTPENGGDTYEDVGWGQSGVGGIGTAGAQGGNTVGPYYNGFGASGGDGWGGETYGQDSYGAGGGGGSRGASGGAVYIQVGGVISCPVGQVVFYADGSGGGAGGSGGVADTLGSPYYAFAGGGGGGGCGGSGGAYIIRYKSGTVSSANASVAGAGGGTGGNIQSPYNANYGTGGGTGLDGTVDIATY